MAIPADHEKPPEDIALVQEREAKAKALDALLASALADAEAGRTYDMDEVFDELLAKIESTDRLRGTD